VTSGAMTNDTLLTALGVVRLFAEPRTSREAMNVNKLGAAIVGITITRVLWYQERKWGK